MEKLQVGEAERAATRKRGRQKKNENKRHAEKWLGKKRKQKTKKHQIKFWHRVNKRWPELKIVSIRRKERRGKKPKRGLSSSKRRSS